MEKDVEFSWVRVWCEQTGVATLRETLGDSEAMSEVEQFLVQVAMTKEVRILNRYVRWNSDGGKSWIEYEPDPRHTELIVKS